MKHKLTCQHCGEHQTITVPAEAFKEWKNGKYIQDAMPDLTADEREMFLTQTCSVCWEDFDLIW
jgi:hypothetical protein